MKKKKKLHQRLQPLRSCGSDIRNRDDLFLLLLPPSYGIDVNNVCSAVCSYLHSASRTTVRRRSAVLLEFPAEGLTRTHYIIIYTDYQVYGSYLGTRYNKSRSRRRRLATPVQCPVYRIHTIVYTVRIGPRIDSKAKRTRTTRRSRRIRDGRDENHTRNNCIKQRSEKTLYRRCAFPMTRSSQRPCDVRAGIRSSACVETKST